MVKVYYSIFLSHRVQSAKCLLALIAFDLFEAVSEATSVTLAEAADRIALSTVHVPCFSDLASTPPIPASHTAALH